MKQHIVDTILELSNRITKLVTIRAGLRELFAEGPETPEPLDGIAEFPISPPAPIHPLFRPRIVTARMAARAPDKSKVPSPKAKVRRGADSNERNLAACAKFAEPFSGVQLSAATGLSKNGAASSLFRWGKRGFVKRVAFGQYERTAKFPAGDGQEPTAEVRSVAERLAAARADLADAVAKHEPTRGRVAADLIAELTRV